MIKHFQKIQETKFSIKIQQRFFYLVFRFRNFDYKQAICITNNSIYNSLQEASEKYKLQYTNMSANCLGKRNYCGKDENGNELKWLYLDDYNYIIDNITKDPLKDYNLVKQYLKSK